LSLQYSRSHWFDLTRVRFATEQSFDSSLAPSTGEAEVEENFPNFVYALLIIRQRRVAVVPVPCHRTYEAA